MSKANRKERKEMRAARKNVARKNRLARKTNRQEGRTKRKLGRQDAKISRQEARQEGRAENLQARILNRKKAVKEQKETVEKELNEEAGQSGMEANEVASSRLENSPQAQAQIKEYIAEQTGEDIDEERSLTDDIEAATLLRGEQIEDSREITNEEIESEGDTTIENFEDFEFYEAGLYCDEEEFPENYESANGVIDPETWALISSASKGGLEFAAQRQFAKGKKFLGKTKEEWTAPGDPKNPKASEILYTQIEQDTKRNWLGDNIGKVIVAVVVVVVIFALAYKGAKK